MGVSVFVARARISNDDGTWDSLGPDGTSPRLKFKTSHTLNEDPNTLNLEIYNVSDEIVSLITGKVRTRTDWAPAERAELLEAGASTAPFETTSEGFGLVNVEFSHGYADSQDLTRDAIEAALGVAFIGQITEGPRIVPSGQDQILTLLALDGGQALGAAEVVQLSGGGPAAYRGKSYGPGTRLSVVLADLINSLGLESDAAELDAQIVQAFAAKGYPEAEVESLGGETITGPSAPKIRAIMSSLDLRWTIQNGEFLILDSDSVIPGFAPVVLSRALSNIVGRPKPNGESKLEVSTTANTLVLPGRPLDVDTPEIQTSYRIDEATTDGDTYSGAQTNARLDALQVIPGVV